MSEQLHHWKKLVNPDYLGSYILDPGQELLLTIKSCANEQITGTDGKKQECMVLRFMEDIKPMILNRTNAKIITKLHKTPYIEQWTGKKIMIYAKQIRAFGEDVDALRIRDFLPQPKELDITSALKKLNESKTLAELQSNYTSLTKEEAANKDIIKLKDTLKTTLK